MTSYCCDSMNCTFIHFTRANVQRHLDAAPNNMVEAINFFSNPPDIYCCFSASDIQGLFAWTRGRLDIDVNAVYGDGSPDAVFVSVNTRTSCSSEGIGDRGPPRKRRRSS